MANTAGKSYEWGTTAKALLELYNPKLPVHSNNAFPGSKIPGVNLNVFTL